MNNCSQISFCFEQGLVDSDTLPLNVSREMLQQHSSLKTIKKKLIRKALDMIRRIAEEDPDESHGEDKKGEYSCSSNKFLKSVSSIVQIINLKLLFMLIYWLSFHSVHLLFFVTKSYTPLLLSGCSQKNVLITLPPFISIWSVLVNLQMISGSVADFHFLCCLVGVESWWPQRLRNLVMMMRRKVNTLNSGMNLESPLNWVLLKMQLTGTDWQNF